MCAYNLRKGIRLRDSGYKISDLRRIRVKKLNIELLKSCPHSYMEPFQPPSCQVIIINRNQFKKIVNSQLISLNQLRSS